LELLLALLNRQATDDQHRTPASFNAVANA